MAQRKTQYALVGRCYAEDNNGMLCQMESCLDERTLLLERGEAIGQLAALSLADPLALNDKYIVKIHPKTKRHFDKTTVETFIQRQKKWQSN